MGLRDRVPFFIAVMFWRPRGLFGANRDAARCPGSESGCSALLPLAGFGNYPLHLVIMCLLWGFVYTGWAVMGRLGMTSFGHGAFFCIGAYVVVMGWNHFGLVALVQHPHRAGAHRVVAFLIGYPCFRLKIVGHYFALVTLALSEIARMIIVALRDQTGGSLGATPNTALADTSWSLVALQFSSKMVWFYIILGLLARRPVGLDTRGPFHGAARARGDQPGRGCGCVHRYRRHAP